MTFEELLAFIDEQDGKITSNISNATTTERVLARTVKLGEEFGELCDEVLSSQGDQRTEKLEGKDRQHLEHEFADVLITALLLAKSLNIDIPQALRSKIAKIRERTYGRGR